MGLLPSKRWCILLLACWAACTPARAAEPSAECLRIGEGSVRGRLVAIEDGVLTLASDGVDRTMRLDDFREVVLAPPATGRHRTSFVARLRDDAALNCSAVRAGGDRLTLYLAGDGWQVRDLPLDALAGVASAGLENDPDSPFRAALRDPPVGADRLSVRREAGRVTVNCTVEAVTGDGLRVASGSARADVAWSDLLWLVPGSAAGTPRAAPRGHLLALTDGSSARVTKLSLRGDELTARIGPAQCVAQADRLERIIVASDAYAYLSDLRPARVETQPLLDVVWPPRLDRCVAGGPISLDGRHHPKGIGMNTRTSMTFALDGRYTRFHATVGVDDAAGRLGRIFFRVLADGRELLTSPPLAGDDPAREVSADVSGARELTLVADFGSPVDASGNLADWASARVVR